METIERIHRDLLDPERREQAAPDRPCTAELAECTCPDFCERDHTNE